MHTLIEETRNVALRTGTREPTPCITRRPHAARPELANFFKVPPGGTGGDAQGFRWDSFLNTHLCIYRAFKFFPLRCGDANRICCSNRLLDRGSFSICISHSRMKINLNARCMLRYMFINGSHRRPSAYVFRSNRSN